MIDPNEILPPETFAWCGDQLRQLGFPGDINGRVCTETEDRVHCQAYVQLRDAARHHWSQGNINPELMETLPPRPGFVPSQETQDLFRHAGQQLNDERDRPGAMEHEEWLLDPNRERNYESASEHQTADSSDDTALELDDENDFDGEEALE